jgi:hypothetical protein
VIRKGYRGSDLSNILIDRRVFSKWVIRNRASGGEEDSLGWGSL